MSRRLGAAVRSIGWGVAIGLFSPVLESFTALALSSFFGSIASNEVAVAALSALLAVAVFALSALAGLSAELPLGVGALGGAIAALLPALVLFLGEGVDALGPPLAAVVRGVGLLACSAAGAAGILLGRRVVRR